MILQDVYSRECSDQSMAYLGPSGTHSEEMVLTYFGDSGRQFIPYPTIDAVIRAAHSGQAAACVVPIENSLEGAINVTMDLLAHEVELKIAGEFIWPVHNHLLVHPDSQGLIRNIFSHPQALAQCRGQLAIQYPDACLRAVSSTAEAAAMVAEQKADCAAIGSMRAGQIYGLKVLKADVQDNTSNCTRFVLLARDGYEPENLDGQPYKTSIVCQINGQRSGSLCEILQEFAQRNVNLTRIESRPARTGLGIYVFFLDVDGSDDQPPVGEALAAVQAKSLWFKNLGSYPTWPVRTT